MLLRGVQRGSDTLTLESPPMKFLRSAVLSLATAFCLQAQATPVAIVDFVNVPVSASAAKPVTADQVRTAIVRAGGRYQWEVRPLADGVLEARYTKGNKHSVVATIQYTDQAYSVTYKDSLNMDYENRGLADAEPVRNMSSPEGVLLASRQNAAAKQKSRYAGDPATPYAVPRRTGEVHANYEAWVRQLMSGIRTELSLL